MPKYDEVGTGFCAMAGTSGAVRTRVAMARSASERGELVTVIWMW